MTFTGLSYAAVSSSNGKKVAGWGGGGGLGVAEGPDVVAGHKYTLDPLSTSSRYGSAQPCVESGVTRAFTRSRKLRPSVRSSLNLAHPPTIRKPDLYLKNTFFPSWPSFSFSVTVSHRSNFLTSRYGFHLTIPEWWAD